MSHATRQNAKHTSSPKAGASKLWRTTIVVVFFGLSVFALVSAIVVNTTAMYGQKIAGNASSTGCSAIKSEASADILAAAKHTRMYQSAAVDKDLIGQALRKGILAHPVLVKPYRQDVGFDQYYVIPVVGTNNIPLAMLKFVYDSGQHQICPSAFAAVTGNMFYASRPFPAVSASAAVAAVQKQYHVDAATGTTPELVYFLPDHVGFMTGKNSWRNGGTAAIDPIWRVAGVDGHWHYVDHNGMVHKSKEIPTESGLPAMPDTVNIQ